MVLAVVILSICLVVAVVVAVTAWNSFGNACDELDYANNMIRRQRAQYHQRAQ